MIRVSLRLSGPLRGYYRAGCQSKSEQVEIPEASTVGDLLDVYGVPHDKVHLVVVNRRRATLVTVLQDGDDVWTIPLAAGG